MKGVNIAYVTEERDDGYIEVKLVNKIGIDRNSWKEQIFQDGILPLLQDDYDKWALRSKDILSEIH